MGKDALVRFLPGGDVVEISDPLFGKITLAGPIARAMHMEHRAHKAGCDPKNYRFGFHAEGDLDVEFKITFPMVDSFPIPPQGHTLINCHASNGGGGFRFSGGGPVNMIGCSATDNSGTGIRADDGATVNAQDCIVTGNQTGFDVPDTATLVNCHANKNQDGFKIRSSKIDEFSKAVQQESSLTSEQKIEISTLVDEYRQASDPETLTELWKKVYYPVATIAHLVTMWLFIVKP